MLMTTTIRSQIQTTDAVLPFLSACRKAAAKLQRVKDGLVHEFRSRFLGNDRMLFQALNEAEALAHETGFPVLTYPALAREKVEAVAAWDIQQKRVRRNWYRALAA